MIASRMHKHLQPNFSKSLYKSVLIRYLFLSSNWMDILIFSMYSMSQLIKALWGYVDLKVLVLMKDTGLVVLKMKPFIISEQERQKTIVFWCTKVHRSWPKGKFKFILPWSFYDWPLAARYVEFFFNVDTCQE